MNVTKIKFAALLLLPLSAFALPHVSETLTLAKGWNAVYIETTADESARARTKSNGSASTDGSISGGSVIFGIGPALIRRIDARARRATCANASTSRGVSVRTQ